jgi:hypothetical protein
LYYYPLKLTAQHAASNFSCGKIRSSLIYNICRELKITRASVKYYILNWRTGP